MVLVCGLGRVVMFSYISASPFVLQGSFGLTPQQFGIAFAVGAVVLIGASQLNVVVLRRWTTRTVLLSALLIGATCRRLRRRRSDRRVGWVRGAGAADAGRDGLGATERPSAKHWPATVPRRP